MYQLSTKDVHICVEFSISHKFEKNNDLSILVIQKNFTCNFKIVRIILYFIYRMIPIFLMILKIFSLIFMLLPKYNSYQILL